MRSDNPNTPSVKPAHAQEHNEIDSPELRALADRLSKEAEVLSLKFPAAVPSARKMLAGPSKGSRWSDIAAALVLVGASWGALAMSQFSSGPISSASSANATPDEPSTAMPLPEDPFTDDTLPTTHFRDLNGAEQEAVLDVLEGQKLAAKLSI